MTEDRSPHDPRAGHDGSLDYHRRMLADPHRVAAYERAIRTLVKPGDVVLDLGTGTGLLAMLAARRGARVHAVESMSIIAAARRLFATNGLSDRITVHHADIRAMAPAEPVDLIVSDFMGRFVVDDEMLEAMAAAGRWLKPTGVVCPSAVRLMVAPVALGHFGPLDAFTAPIAGLDVGPLSNLAMSHTYPVDLDAHALIAAPACYHEVRTPDAEGAFDHALTFAVTRAGRLRGIAGWFEATLAPQVALSTAPGIETHWQQLLFPLPACHVALGDSVTLRLWLETSGGAEHWQWEGVITQAHAGSTPFALSAVGRLEAGPPASRPPLSEARLRALHADGAAAFASGDYLTAIDHWQAAAAGLVWGRDAMAAPLYENLGLAYVHAGRWTPAIGAFLLALDGDPTARQQSSRFLVDACFRANRIKDGQRYLAAYEATFGAHPSGWDAETKP